MAEFSTILSTLQDFHFVRPWWLLALIPAVLLGWALKYRQPWQNSWQSLIDPVLLAPLLKGSANQPGKLFPLTVILFWTLAILALAGPAWQKLPQQVQKIDNALVILLDLSPSMLASDIKPARLVATRHKIIDLLNARHEGYTALIAYSGDAHVVAPLTDDNQTIINLVNVLEPAIMPIDGSNLEHALQKAFQLFENSGYNSGDILLFTDGVTEQAAQHAKALLEGKNFTLSIIGIGTETGAPIPSARGGFIKDEQGNIIMPSLNSATLKSLARHVNGTYSLLQLGDEDILPLIKGTQHPNQQKTTLVEREFDQWQDVGALLAWPLLALLLLSFRRGLLVSFLLALPLLHTSPVQAEDSLWEKLWLNDNQRAMKAMKQQDYKIAADTFGDPDWKASAQYESQDYKAALEQFRKDNSAHGLYNQGNALAKSGDLQNALKAYEASLNKTPDFDDARFNKALVEQLLRQQEKNPDQQNNSGEQPEQTQSSQDPQTDAKNTQDSTQPNNQPESSQKQNASEQENGENRDLKENPANPPSSKEDAMENSPQNKKPDGKNQAQNKEEQQAMEQWLRKVPDDPAALLRNKFQYYYQQQLQQQNTKQYPSHLNNEDRW